MMQTTKKAGPARPALSSYHPAALSKLYASTNHNNSRIDAATVKSRIDPRTYYAGELIEAPVSRWRGEGWNDAGLCPFHADNRAGSFRVHLGSGAYDCFACNAKGGDLIAFHMHKHGLGFADALKDLSGTPVARTPAPRIETRPKPAESPESRRGRYQRMMQAARPIEASDPAACYLHARGLRLASFPRMLRHAPALSYRHADDSKTFHPAMLAAVQGPDGRLVSIHRTYLTADGAKAPVPEPKKLMPAIAEGATTGAAIRLHPVQDDRLIVAEGIETALALHMLTGRPAWACVSAPGLASVILPPQAREIIIGADLDRSATGEKAARTLRERLRAEGRSVHILMPSKAHLERMVALKGAMPKSCDWADVLNMEVGA
ncbi:DUF7146 domain-containing protein [Thermithiobacillus plumbiphilus]|uniref:Toprim domain-containing protein n=1 Tax=Thermithiobacillus plumbiphilus TaxID=1729899 RepID=A0ABU9DBR5_9PROT